MILQYYQFIRQDDVVRDKEMRLIPKICSNLVKTKRHIKHLLYKNYIKKKSSLTKKCVQKLYKMCTKIIQNTKCAYILYTKIVKIKILYDNEHKRNVHQTYIQKMYKLYKTYTTR